MADSLPNNDTAAYICPGCKGLLESQPQALRCPACNLVYPLVEGIPDFLAPDNRLASDPILQCYLLEKNGLDAYVLGLSIDSPVGSNVCSVNVDGGIQVLEGSGDISPLFPLMTELAAYYTELEWMYAGDVIRRLKASQVTQVTSDTTHPSVLELPWGPFPMKS